MIFVKHLQKLREEKLDDIQKINKGKRSNNKNKIYWTTSKLKNCAPRDTINQMKRKPTEWEKIFANHISGNDSDYIKYPYNSISKQTTHFKNE